VRGLEAQPEGIENFAAVRQLIQCATIARLARFVSHRPQKKPQHTTVAAWAPFIPGFWHLDAALLPLVAFGGYLLTALIICSCPPLNTKPQR
jgi:hypothetical protein